MVTAQKLSALVSLLNRFAPQMTEVERLWLQDVLIPDLSPQPAVDVPVVMAESAVDVPVVMAESAVDVPVVMAESAVDVPPGLTTSEKAELLRKEISMCDCNEGPVSRRTPQAEEKETMKLPPTPTLPDESKIVRYVELPDASPEHGYTPESIEATPERKAELEARDHYLATLALNEQGNIEQITVEGGE